MPPHLASVSRTHRNAPVGRAVGCTAGLRLLLGVPLVSLAVACASVSPGEMGPTGLEGALPGGDGRAALAYRAEFQGSLVQGIDSLTDVLQEAWRRDDPVGTTAAYDEAAWVLAPDGSLIRGREAIQGWLEDVLPRSGALETWRDDYVGSGEMAYFEGRYEAPSSQPGLSHRGVHVTIAKRTRQGWRIRAQLFLPSEGTGVVVDPTLIAHDPPHITPDAIRARRGGPRSVRLRNHLADWAVETYWRDNSVLSEWRYHWNRDAVDSVTAMMAFDGVLRLPWDVLVSGAGAAETSLARFLPAVGALQMSILDFDASEWVSFSLGRYVLDLPTEQQTGTFLAVVRQTDGGPKLRALVMAGAGLGGDPTGH